MAQHSSKGGDRKTISSLIQPQTGKTRAGRIPLDYYKKRSDLSAKKLLLSGILIIAGLGYVFSGEFFNEGGTARLGPIELSRDARINHGPLHAKHAGFEKQCNLCHEPFAAIGSGRARPGVGSYAIGDWKVSDNKCQACHKGPDHHPMKPGGTVLACADCHRDHLGRNVELARQSDQACVDCHKNLDVAGREAKPSDAKAAEEPIANAVSHFEYSEDGKASAVVDGVWNKTDYPTMWRHPVDRLGTIVLDLGEERVVEAVRIWNFNEPGGMHRGWKEVEVFVTSSPTALNKNAAGIVLPAPGAADTTDYSTTIPVPAVKGRYVTLQAKSVWRPDTYTGLSEVQVLGY